MILKLITILRFIFLKYLIFVSLILGENIFAQSIEDKNYEIIILDKNCRSGFYLSKYFDFVQPYSPTQKDYDVVFGIPDSSNIEIRIFAISDNETIVSFDMKIGKGCYQLNWIKQNLEKLKSGFYICSLEAHQQKALITSDFYASQKIIIIK